MNNYAKNINYQYKDICFYIFWTALLVGRGLGWTNEIGAFRTVLYICSPFLLIKLLADKWNRNDIVCAFLINIASLLCWLFSGNVDFFLTTVIITCSKNINIPKLFMYSFWIKLIMFVSRTSMAILGYIDNTELYRFANGEIIAKRYALGYGHPNATHYNLFAILVLCIISYKRRLKRFHFLIMFLYNIFIFKYTTSRTGVFMTSLLIIISYFVINNKSFMHNIFVYAVKKITYKLYIYLAIISFIICIFVDKLGVLLKWNTLVARFITAVATIQNTHISLFGSKNIATDFGYVNMLYSNGIIAFILFLLASTAILHKIDKNKLYIEKLIILLYGIYTLSEAYSLSILMNVTLIYSVMLIYPKTSKNGVI